jgi:hypothetical protein
LEKGLARSFIIYGEEEEIAAGVETLVPMGGLELVMDF